MADVELISTIYSRVAKIIWCEFSYSIGEDNIRLISDRSIAKLRRKYPCLAGVRTAEDGIEIEFTNDWQNANIEEIMKGLDEYIAYLLSILAWSASEHSRLRNHEVDLIVNSTKPFFSDTR